MANKRRLQREKRLRKNEGRLVGNHSSKDNTVSIVSESSLGESFHDDESVHDDEIDLKVGDKLIAPTIRVDRLEPEFYTPIKYRIFYIVC